MVNNNPTSIAILRLAALGDICMTIPVVCSLRKHFPDAHIYWIISKNMIHLVENLQGVTFIPIDKPYSLKGYWQCWRQLQSYQFDALLVPQASFRSNLLCPLIKAKDKYGYGKLHSRDFQRVFVNKTVPAVKEHLVDGFLRFAEALGAPHEKPQWDIPLGDEDYAWADKHLNGVVQPIITVCPTTSKSERNWSDDRYIEVLNYLQKKWRCSVVLVGDSGQVSMRSSQRIASGLLKPCINLTATSNVKQLAAVLSRSDIVIAPDTGPAHIANAVGTPVVGLYGVISSKKTGPYNSVHYCVDKFPEAVTKILKKDINSISWRQRVHDNQAMMLITVEDVIEKCNALLTHLQFSQNTQAETV